MRIVVLMALVAGIGLGGGKLDILPCAAATAAPANQAEPLFSWHFAGKAALSGDTNASRLREVWDLPSTQQLVSDTQARLRRAFVGYFGGDPAATNRAIAKMADSLFDYLLMAETTAECWAGTGSTHEWVLVVRGGTLDSRIAEWNEFVAALGAPAPAEIKLESYTVLEAKRDRSPNRFRLARAGKYLVLGCGESQLPGYASVLSRIKSSGRPSPPLGGQWLEVGANLPRLVDTLGLPKSVTWPSVELAFTGKGQHVRSTAKLTYAEPMRAKLGAWQIPTNTIREPVTSFTAIQGVGPWIAQQPWFKQLGWQSAPNQLFTWSLQHIPFQTYLAWRLPDPTNTLRQSAPRFPSLLQTNFPQLPLDLVKWETNVPPVSVYGLPIIVPFLRPGDPADGDVVMAGIFPPDPSKKTVPPQLYAQVLGRTNLVYFNWEITSSRVEDWRNLFSQYEVVAGYMPASARTAAQTWLSDTNMVRQLGNSGTDIVLASPRELSLTRTSALGLDGFEIVALARWLDNPAFPAWHRPRLIGERTRAAQPPRPPGVPAVPAPRR